MPYRYIHPAQKSLIVSLSSHMTPREIQRATHGTQDQVHRCTVERLIKKKRETGDVVHHSTILGRRRELNGLDCDVCAHHSLSQPTCTLTTRALLGLVY